MTKKEYLRRILNVSNNSPSYPEMDTEIRKYNRFIKTLKLDFFDDISDKIFIELCNEGETFKSITAKSKGKECVENILIKLANMQSEYYKNNIYPNFKENELGKHSLSDYQILISEHKSKHSIVITEQNENIFYLDRFFISFQEHYGEINK